MKNGTTISTIAAATVGFLCPALLWWMTTALNLVDPLILPSPAKVAVAMKQLLTPEGLLRDFAYTLWRVTAALAISIAVGVPVGLWLGWQSRIYRFVEGPIHALRSVPAAALFPLFLIFIGVGERSIVLLAAYNSIVVVLINTIAGALLANQRRIQQARILGVSGWRLITQVMFWEALPHILSGIRIATGYGLALIIAVEMFIGVSNLGLGRKIYDYQAAYRIPETYAAILLTGALGLGLNGVLSMIEHRLLRWLPMTHENTEA